MKLSDKLSIITISSLTHKLILLLLLINFLTLVFLPLIISRVISIDIGNGYTSLFVNKPLFYYFLVLLYIVGIIALVILNDLRLLFKSCLEFDVFTHVNVNRLGRMAIMAFIISFLFLTKVFVVNSIMTIIVVFVFFMASVFCLVLTLLFDQAVHYKEENDLTI